MFQYIQISYKKTDRQYYEYYEWTNRYYEWTDEWTDEFYELTDEYYKWKNEYCEWVNEYYECYEWSDEYEPSDELCKYYEWCGKFCEKSYPVIMSCLMEESKITIYLLKMSF